MKKGKQLGALICVASLLCSLTVGCTVPAATTLPGSTPKPAIPTTAPTSGIQPTTVPPTIAPPTSVPPTTVPPSTDISGSTMTREEQIAMYQKIATEEAAWLASLQAENGALLMTGGSSGQFTMNPYFADFAALALLGAGESYYENVRRYMDWHFAHLNTAETDYNGVDGTAFLRESGFREDQHQCRW